MKDPKKLN